MPPSSSLREMFDQAVALAPESRADFLSTHCVDPVLREHVQRLLAADVPADDVLLGGGAQAAARAIGDDDLAHALPPGSRIGPFRLLGVLGEGGSSTVFRASRDVEGVNQQVALKLLRRGLYSPDAQKQFRRERQALAQLRHPGIAHLIEGGVTENGLAYIALELVEGTSLTDFARERRLDVRQRLELFLQVCRAVEAAHRALIVHRDLKPSNVLVTNEGQVKLLDFGIAKLLDGDEELQTQLPSFTPAYAAPEQRSGALITTATDVYALGILLGELITGQRLTENTGQTPSSQIRHDRDPGVLPATPQATRRSLRGDLDNIVLKAIELEPERRYASAGALADDIDRLTSGRPVAAHPPSTWYRAQKFVQRHRGAVASTFVFVLAIFAALTLALWQATVARREAQAAEAERNHARHEAVRATATRDFLIRVFRASDPRIAQDKPRGQITAKELLDISAPRIATEFANDTDTQIQLLGVAASIYHAFDDQQQYQTLHRQQLELARKQYGDLHPVVIDDLIDDASDASHRNDFKQALQLLDQVDPLIHRAALDDSMSRARWWLVRGDALSGDLAAQDQRMLALKNAVDLYAKLAPDSDDYSSALDATGSALAGQMKDGEAVKYFARAITIAEHASERNDAGLQTLYGNLASSLLYEGDFDGAESAYAKIVDIARRTTGEDHHKYWVPAANYAAMVHQRGDRERAQRMFDALLPLLPEHPTAEQLYDVSFVRETYARMLANEGRAPLAIALLEAVHQQYTQAQLDEFDLRRVSMTLGDAYDQVGRDDEARRTLKSVLDEWIAKGSPDFYPVLAIRERWGRLALKHGDPVEAEKQFNEVIAQAHDRQLTPIALTYAGLAKLAIARNDIAAALAASAKAIATFDHVSGFRNVRTGPYLWLIRADVLRRSGDALGAHEWAQRALDASRRYDDPSASSIRDAQAAVQAAKG